MPKTVNAVCKKIIKVKNSFEISEIHFSSWEFWVSVAAPDTLCLKGLTYYFFYSFHCKTNFLIHSLWWLMFFCSLILLERNHGCIYRYNDSCSDNSDIIKSLSNLCNYSCAYLISLHNRQRLRSKQVLWVFAFNVFTFTK